MASTKPHIVYWVFFDLIKSGRNNPHILLASQALKRVLSVFMAVGKANETFGIPALALTVIQAHGYKTLMPLQALSASRTWLDSFKELEHLAASNLDKVDREDLASSALKEAFLNFRQAKSIKTNSLLRVTVLSIQRTAHFCSVVDAGLASWDFSNVDRITVVSLVDPRPGLNKEVIREVLPTPSNSKQQLEYVNVIADEFVLEGHFKSWLRSTSDSKREFLALNLPEGIGVLKCDASEIVINPLLLPFPRSFSLHATDEYLAQGAASLGGKTCLPHLDLPVLELEVLFPIKCAGFCQSLIYGQPLRLVPTLRPAFEWNELQANQKLFQVCCQSLKEQGAFFVAKLLPRARLDQVLGTFVIMPGTDALLLFAAAAREIYLPSDNFLIDSNEDEDDQTSLLQTKAAVRSMISSTVRDVYNPLEVSTGLYEVLLNNAREPSNLPASSVSDTGNKYTLPYSSDTINASAHPVTVCDFPPRVPKLKNVRSSKLRRN